MKLKKVLLADRLNNPFVILFAILIVINYFIDDFIPFDLAYIDILGFEFKPGTFLSVSVFFWAMSFKTEVILLCCMWFITCKHWWRFVIIIPLIIEIYKFIGLFDYSDSVIDESEFVSSLPLTLPLIALLVFVLWKDYEIRIQNRLLREVDSEIEELLKKSSNQQKLEELEMQFTDLLSRKSSLNAEDYVEQLNVLRSKIYSY